MLRISSLLDYLETDENLKEKSQKLDEEILFPFKILAWKKLSEQDLLPKNYNFFEFIKNNKRKDDFIEIVNYFSNDDDAKNWRIFLSQDLRFLEKYDEAKLIKNINRANILEDYPNWDELYEILIKSNINIAHISDDVDELLISLLDLYEFENVYNPYPNVYELALKINKKLNMTVFTEDVSVTSLPYILNVLYDANLKIQFSDPIKNPSYREGYSLTMFDAVVSVPPVSRKIDFDLKNDIYNRFNFRDINRVSPTAIYILQIIAQTKNKAFIIVPAFFLNRSLSADIEFRKFLLNANIIDTVILLPENISDRAYINLALLILDRQKTDQDVLFVDAGKVCIKDDRGRIKNIEINKITEAIEKRNEEPDFSFTASYQKIQENEYSLNPKTYMNFSKLAKIYNDIELIKLSEIAEVILSPLVRRREGNLEVLEIQPTDIDEFGLIKNSTSIKKVELTEAELEKAKIKNFDILLVTKGIKETVGKIGIVLDKSENDLWIPGQSIVIIRPENERLAKALFMFLSTNESKEMLNSLAGGSVLLNIPIKALRDMKIPELNKKRVEEFSILFEEFRKNYLLMENIKDNISKIKEKILSTLKE